MKKIITASLILLMMVGCSSSKAGNDIDSRPSDETSQTVDKYDVNSTDSIIEPLPDVISDASDQVVFDDEIGNSTEGNAAGTGSGTQTYTETVDPSLFDVSRLSYEDFDEFYASYQEFKQHATDVLDNLTLEISHIESIISEETVYETIYSVLEESFEDIQTYIDNYQEIYERMGELETELVYYATYNINAAKAEILATIQWDDMDDLSYYSNIDYYQKAKEYYKRPTPPPGPTEEEIQIIIATAIQMFLDETD